MAERGRNRSLAAAFAALLSETEQLSAEHRRFAENVSANVADPLKVYARQQMATAKKAQTPCHAPPPATLLTAHCRAYTSITANGQSIDLHARMQNVVQLSLLNLDKTRRAFEQATRVTELAQEKYREAQDRVAKHKRGALALLRASKTDLMQKCSKARFQAFHGF